MQTSFGNRFSKRTMIIFSKIRKVDNASNILKSHIIYHNFPRNIKTKHGIIYPEPKRTSFGILRVLLTITTGLFVGATISKHIANFLEENELFVPSDDDDDDD